MLTSSLIFVVHLIRILKRKADEKAKEVDDTMEGAMQNAAMGTGKLGKAGGKTRGKNNNRKYRKGYFKSAKTKENHSKSMERQIETGNFEGQIADVIARCRDYGTIQKQLCLAVNKRLHGIAPISKEEDKYLDWGFTVVGVAGLENLGVLLDVADATCRSNKKGSRLRVYLRKPVDKGCGGTYLWFEEGEETDRMQMHNSKLNDATFQYTRPAEWMTSEEREDFIAKYNKEY